MCLGETQPQFGGPTQAKGVCRNIYNEDVYKLFDDVALSSPEQSSLG